MLVPRCEHILRHQSFLPRFVQLCPLQFLDKVLMLSRRIWGQGGIMPPGFSACYPEDSESIFAIRSHCYTSETAPPAPDKSRETELFVTTTFLDLEVQTVKVTELFKKSKRALFPSFPLDWLSWQTEKIPKPSNSTQPLPHPARRMLEGLRYGYCSRTLSPSKTSHPPRMASGLCIFL